MHILIMILTVLSVIGVWVWRINMARRGAAEAIELAKTAANAPRRLAFRYKAGKNGLALIEDPREAAAIMMMEVALARGGPLTRTQEAVMLEEVGRHFSFGDEEAEALLAHAAWVSQSAPPQDETMRKLSQLILTDKLLGPKEVVDLDSMLVAVSEAEGVPTRHQMTLLQVYRNKVGLKT